MSKPQQRRQPDLSVVRALVTHDLTAVKRTPGLMVPIVVLPLILLVLTPLAASSAARNPDDGLGRLLEAAPRRLAEPLFGLPMDEQVILMVLGYLMAPLFVMVPLMVSAVLAADSFAGERDRRTLESMLHNPVPEHELYLAKLCAAFIPAVGVAWIGFACFATVANIAAWDVMGRPFLPTWRWLILVLWIAPAAAALGLGVMVRLSIRARSSQEAQQLGSAVVLPLIVVVVAQASYLLVYPVPVSIGVGAMVWVAAVVLNWRGATRFSRDAMATKV